MRPRFHPTILLASAAALLNPQLQAQALSFTHPITLGVNTGIAADSTGIYISATSPASQSSGHALIRKYDSGGVELWTRQVDEVSAAQAVAVAAAGIYLAGEIDWQPASAAIKAGFRRAFVRLYDVNGNELWTHRIADGPAADWFTGASVVAADSTGVYLATRTYSLPASTSIQGPGMLHKFDSLGVEQWTASQRVGYSSLAMRAENGNLYSAGTVSANQGPPGDPVADFISQYNAMGEEIWLRQFYTNADGTYGYPAGIAINAGNVFVTGRAFLYPAGGSFGFVRAFNPGGADKWASQFQSGNTQGIISDSDGIYVTGSIFGVLPGQCSAGASDAFIRRYSLNGSELWTHQFGTYGSDEPAGIAMDGNAVYAAGYTTAPGGTFFSRMEKKSDARTGPHIQSECVLNAASLLSGGVVPGEIVTIQGSSIGPVEAVSFTPGPGGIVGNSLVGTRVLFNGIAGPMLSTSADQATAVVPGLPGDGQTVDVQVEYQGVLSDPVTLPRLGTRPGIFTLDRSGNGQAAALNQDGSINSPSNPAARGSVITLFVTGGGPFDALVPDGQILSSSIPRLRTAPSVVFTDDSSLGTPDWGLISVYGEPAPPFGSVLYAGGVAGSIAGVSQINVSLPDIPGNQLLSLPVQVFFGGDPANAISSGASVTVAVR